MYWINWEIVERETWTGGSENSEGINRDERGKLFEEQNGYDIESLADTVFEANKGESMNPF